MSSKEQKEESQEGITVAIRMRPLNNVEGNKHRIWKVLPQYSSIAQTTKEGKPLSERITGRTFFTFDKTFGEDVNTAQVYDSCAKGIVSSVVHGLNGTIFAYGQTSSGKTYTMQGSGSIEEGSDSSGGIVHMAAKDIFSHIQSQQDRMFLVRASFLEIYNEEVRDLLSDSNQMLQIREDPRRGVFVQSVEEMATDFESLLRILFHGEKSRAVASTGMNERSSRSHTIFRITIESREREYDGDDQPDEGENRNPSGDGSVRVSTLNLVDLAGSESVRHTGATGKLQKEGGMINQSLLTLSRVIVALGTPNQTHINFRDSKLTRILQPSLSGNARMAVICCATPSELYLEETRSTLQFASRAKLVKTNAQVNEVLDDRSIIRRLQRELAEARRRSSSTGTEQVKALENKAATAGTVAKEAEAKLDRLKASILNAGYLFGNQNAMKSSIKNSSDPQQEGYGRKSRKRRQSDGALYLKHSSPTKNDHQVDVAPKTAPRKKKQTTSIRSTLSPLSELRIVREALASRTLMTRALQTTVTEHSQLLGKKDRELQQLFSQNESMQEAKIEKENEANTMRQTIASLQLEFNSCLSEHEKVLETKEAVIADSLSKIELVIQENQDLQTANTRAVEAIQKLESDLQSANTEKGVMMIRIASLEIESSGLNDEKVVLMNEVDKLMNAKNGLDEKISKMNELSETLKGNNDTLNDEKVVLQDQVNDLLRERDTSNEATSVLQTELRQLQEELAESKKGLLASESEISILKSQNEKAVNDLDVLETEKTSIETEVQSLLEEASMAKSENAALLEKVEELSSEATATKDRIEEVEGALHAEAEKASSLVAENESSMVTIAELESEMVTLEAEVQLLREEISKSKSENESLLNQVEELLPAREEANLLRAQKTESKQIHEDLQNKLDEISTENASLSAEKLDLETRMRDLQAFNNELDSRRIEVEEANTALEAERNERESQIATLKNESMMLIDAKDTNAAALSAMQQQIDSLEENLALEKKASEELRNETKAHEEDNECHRQKLEEANESLLSENRDIKDRLSNVEVEKTEIESELILVKRHLDQANIDLEHAATLRANLSKQLLERENERDDATMALEKEYEKNRDLGRILTDSLPKEKENELLSEISSIKALNTELTQLLASSNESEERSRNAVAMAESKYSTKTRELEDALYRLSQMEEELRLAEMAENDDKKMDNSNSDLFNQIEVIRSEKETVEALLNREREEWQKSEEELKKRMGEEQRILINEGETRMLELRRRIDDLETKLNQSEGEAYVARQQVEEIMDQKKSLESSYMTVESNISSLKETVARQESQASVLQSDLNKARAECYALKESSIEMKEKMRRATRDSEKAARETEIASSESSTLRRKVANLERSNKEQQQEIQKLKKEYLAKDNENKNEGLDFQEIEELNSEVAFKNKRIEKLDSEIAALKEENQSVCTEMRKLKIALRTGGGTSVVSDTNKLEREIARLSDQMRQKDKRIKKLEAVRLTKEQVESIKKLKADNITLEKKYAKLVKENEVLQAQLGSVESDSVLKTELSELRFDKEALESKLRKFASHCQRLEDEKASTIDALRSCDINFTHEDDINEAIITLCDQLASKSARDSPGESEHLKQENRSLMSKLESLSQSEKQLTSTVTRYQVEIEELKRSMRDSDDDASGVKSQMGRKLRFLEQENLQLMLDVKSSKKQLQNAREEVEMLRLNAVDNQTMDFGNIDIDTTDTIELTEMVSKEINTVKSNDGTNKRIRNSAESLANKRSRTKKQPLVEITNKIDKENCAPGRNSNRAILEKSNANRNNIATPGLGEAATHDNDNTGECTQS